MGAGGSVENSPRLGGSTSQKYEAGAGAVAASFEASPFEGDSPFSQDSKANGGGGNAPVMSERKLKKMALGLPGYKDVQRDYDETLSELGKFNTNKSEDWVAPVGDAQAPVKQERLYDGYAYGKSAAKGPNPVEAQVDPRQLQRQRQQQAVAAGAPSSSPSGPVGPHNKPQPPRRPGPAPPRPAGPISHPTKAVSVGATAGAGAPTSDPRTTEVMAPTYLAPPIAGIQGAPPTLAQNAESAAAAVARSNAAATATQALPSVRQSGGRPGTGNANGNGAAGELGLIAGAEAIMNGTPPRSRQNPSRTTTTTTTATTTGTTSLAAPAKTAGAGSGSGSGTTPVKAGAPLSANSSANTSPAPAIAPAPAPAKSAIGKKAPVGAKTKTKSNDSDSDEYSGGEDTEGGSGLYEWTAFDTSADYKAGSQGGARSAGVQSTQQNTSSHLTATATATTADAGAGGGDSRPGSSVAGGTPVRLKAPAQPPPGYIATGSGSGAGAGGAAGAGAGSGNFASNSKGAAPPSQGLPIRPFPKDKLSAADDDNDDMYATFGPGGDEPPLTPKKPHFIPMLNIDGGGGGSGGSGSHSHSNEGTGTGTGGNGGSSNSMSTNPGVQQQQQHVGTGTGTGMGMPRKPTEKPAPPSSSPGPVKTQPGVGFSGGPNPAAAAAAAVNASNPNQRLPASRAAPPKPGAKNPHEVKETTEVNRNKAQLPQALTHAKPTTGDWLKKRYIVNNYILLDILGTGSYGEVRLCKDRTTDHLFAVKIFSKDMLRKKKGGSTETYFEDVKREIAVMKKLLHPNVLRLFEVLDDPNVNKMYLILEYMKKGDLINILQRNAPKKGGSGDSSADQTGGFSPLGDLELWNIFRQVAAGIRYLHFQNIVHGDIKPQNLLVGEDGVVKIADFGIAKMLHASGQKLVDSSGTPAFMSPELFDAGGAFSGQLADIWAMGATMFMLRFGSPPFVAKNVVTLSNKIQNDALVFPSEIDDKLRDLLENMLVKNPNGRFTLQQVIMHPWMRVQPAPAPAPPSPAAHSAAAKGGGGPADKFRVGPASADAKSSGVSLLGNFAPPSTYEASEAAAMKKGPISASLNKEDIYMSIGYNKSKPRGAAGGNGDDGDFIAEEAEEEEVGGDADGAGEDSDLMATKWGADLFEMVDDDINSGSDDDETVGNSQPQGKTTSDGRKAGNGGGGRGGNMDTDGLGMMSTLGERSEMSVEEEEVRAHRFKKSGKQRRSNESMDTAGGGMTVEADGTEADEEEGEAAAAAAAGPRSSVNVAETMRVADKRQMGKSPPKFEAQVPSGPRPNPLGSGADSRTGAAQKTAPGDEEEDEGEDLEASTEKLSMKEFGAMMDTLSLQPKSKKLSSVEPLTMDVKPATFSVQLRNLQNGVGAAFHSEQGQRPAQEDRCVLLPDVSAMRALQGNEKVTPAIREQLAKFSVAAVFDGHSGWQCSQYLSQHLVPALALHEKFLDKQPDSALLETFKLVDAKLGSLLRQEECTAGSTAIVAVYDGRRHILTVANVGDSMCVLSRSGRAVKMNRVHRVIADLPECAPEIARVESTGSRVIHNRVDGVLAISRAFGDVSFKHSSKGPGPLISVPDISSEVITPMTEFGIIACDGLWDVMEPQLAVNFIRKLLAQKNDLQHAAAELVREALAKGSVDNVTVLIVSFHMVAPPSGKDKDKEEEESKSSKAGAGGK